MLTLPDKVEQYLRKNDRYDAWAYAFIYEALGHTVKLFKLNTNEEVHVTATQLCEGICSLATQDLSILARTIFSMWGIKETEDIGEIVFILVECEVIRQNEDDSKEDFIGLFDLMDRLDPDKMKFTFKARWD